MIRTGNNNHVELVHRPGESHLATRLLSLLGCDPVQLGAPVAGTTFQSSRDNILWVSEVTPEQWSFELWLQQQMQVNGDAASRAYVGNLNAFPQKHPHFGIGQVTLADWESLVARLLDAAANDPLLAGRISLPVVARPGDDGSVLKLSGGKLGHTIYQAFLRTDIISSGLLAFGQSIEIQHRRENDPSYVLKS